MNSTCSKTLFPFSLHRSWEQCDSEQDYLTIHDGKTLEAPMIGRICGGDALPDIVSSGSDMTIQFRTSPYDVLFHPNPVTFLPGFELEVHVSSELIS